MKGIIVAGGLGTRLYPLTKVISKHLLPVYDKPMVYYPLSILILTGIKQILIITTAEDYQLYYKLLQDGKQLGCDFQYAIQKEPNGIAEAFILGEEFIGDDEVMLILGDNLFYSIELITYLQRLTKITGAYIFAYEVEDPHRYGIVELDQNNKVLSLEEKPLEPKSNYAITGLYIYDNNVIQIAKNIRRSIRGEYEITDINQLYLKQNHLNVYLLNSTTIWFDMGTFQSLHNASILVRQFDEENQIKIGSIEQAAFEKHFITKEQLFQLSQSSIQNDDRLHLTKN